jgi:integrase
MTSIFKVKDKWRCQVMVNGVRHSKYFTLKKDAHRWAANVISYADAMKDKQTRPKYLTVSDLFLRYMEEVSVNKASCDNEKIRIKRFLNDAPRLATKKLADVTKNDIDEWIINRQRQVSDGTVKRELNTIRNAFKIAHERWEWIEKNPFVGAKTIKSPPARDRILTWREIKLFLKQFQYAQKIIMETKTQEIGVIFLIALRTGMRLGEIIQLGKDNVDFTKKTITIKHHKTLHHTGKPRIIPFNDGAYKLLKKLPIKEKYFTVDTRVVDTLFRRNRNKLGLNDIHFHDSRATALTILSKKLQPMDLAKVSGHTSLNILLNTYYREKPEDIAVKMSRVIKKSA